MKEEYGSPYKSQGIEHYRSHRASSWNYLSSHRSGRGGAVGFMNVASVGGGPSGRSILDGTFEFLPHRDSPPHITHHSVIKVSGLQPSCGDRVLGKQGGGPLAPLGRGRSLLNFAENSALPLWDPVVPTGARTSFPCSLASLMGPRTSPHFLSPLGFGVSVKLLPSHSVPVLPGTGSFALQSQGLPLLPPLARPCHLSPRQDAGSPGCEQGQGSWVKGGAAFQNFWMCPPRGHRWDTQPNQVSAVPRAAGWGSVSSWGS